MYLLNDCAEIGITKGVSQWVEDVVAFRIARRIILIKIYIITVNLSIPKASTYPELVKMSRLDLFVSLFWSPETPCYQSSL